MVNSYDLEVRKILKQIKQQFSDGNCTEYGEPQAFMELENGRSIEVTLEQYGLPEDEYYYSVRLHCSSVENDNNEYNSTCGVIDQYATSSDDIKEIKPLIASALKCNDFYHPEILNTKKDSDINNMQNKWENLFDNFLELTEFNLVKNETYKALFKNPKINYEEYQSGFWSLDDLQGGNIGNICGERFMNAAQIFERMEIYIDDYIVFPLQEIRKIDKIDVPGYDLNEYMQWEDYVINREYFRKDYQSDIDYLDMICNHADEIDLNNCTFVYKERDKELSLKNKIKSAENRIYTVERAEKVYLTNLSK